MIPLAKEKIGRFSRARGRMVVLRGGRLYDSLSTPRRQAGILVDVHPVLPDCRGFDTFSFSQLGRTEDHIPSSGRRGRGLERGRRPPSPCGLLGRKLPVETSALKQRRERTTINLTTKLRKQRIEETEGDEKY